MYSNREARKRPARGHFRNGPWTWKHTHTHVNKQDRYRTKRTSVNTPHVFERHTPETAINYVFNLIYLTISLCTALFISCIGIIIIWCTYSRYLHCLDFIYLWWTIIFVVLCIFIVWLYSRAYICMRTCLFMYVFISNFHVFFQNHCYKFAIIFTVICSFHVCMYAGMNICCVSHSVVYTSFFNLFCEGSGWKNAHISTCSGVWNRYW